MPEPYYLDSCTYIINLKIQKSDVSHFTILEIVLAILAPFTFPYQYYTKLVYIYKEMYLDFNMYFIKPIDKFGTNLHHFYDDFSNP